MRLKIPAGVNAVAFFVALAALYFLFQRSQPISSLKREKYEKALEEFPFTKVFVESKVLFIFQAI